MPDLDERKRAYAYGRKCRDHVGRSEHCNWKPHKRRDPLAILRGIAKTRLAPLLPIKIQRMSVSPFGYFRGAAAVMAADLAAMPHSGILAQICGDAHVLNLGSYAAPDGRLIFDINDFDETIAAPWEWDVKRLATSLVLGGRDAKESDAHCSEAVAAFARVYRSSMQDLSKLSVLDLARYQVHRNLHTLPLESVLHKAQRTTPQENLQKFAVRDAKGQWHFREERPLLFPVKKAQQKEVLAALSAYRSSLLPERQHVFDSYRPADVAFKVVGTGSVGTRDYLVLMFGRDVSDPLFLQVKEEPASCYARYLPESRAIQHQGKRVVFGQRLMQAQSDILLGWTSMDGHDYLVRQLSDHKATIDIKTLHGEALSLYAELCGEVLAKGHARSGNPCVIAGYLGAAPKFDEALIKFALAYANQTTKDFQRFLASYKTGEHTIPGPEA